MTQEQLLTRVLVAWLKFPDLRLGQFLTNAAGKAGWRTNDLFYAENEFLFKAVSQYAGITEPPTSEDGV